MKGREWDTKEEEREEAERIGGKRDEGKEGEAREERREEASRTG